MHQLEPKLRFVNCPHGLRLEYVDLVTFYATQYKEVLPTGTLDSLLGRKSAFGNWWIAFAGQNDRTEMQRSEIVLGFIDHKCRNLELGLVINVTCLFLLLANWRWIRSIMLTFRKTCQITRWRHDINRILFNIGYAIYFALCVWCVCRMHRMNEEILTRFSVHFRRNEK